MNKQLSLILIISLLLPAISHGSQKDICENIDEITSLVDTELKELEIAANEYFQSAYSQYPEIHKGSSELPENWLKQEFYAELAMCFMTGEFTLDKTEKAKYFLTVSENAGSKKAAHILASLRVFHSSDFAEQALGVKYLESEGSPYAAGKLGWAYQHGYGVEADLTKAIKLYHYAAENGMTYWQFLLSHAYERGYLGLEIDKDRARYWRNYEPRVHLAKYECWLVTYYQDGTFPSNEKELQKYTRECFSDDK